MATATYDINTEDNDLHDADATVEDTVVEKDDSSEEEKPLERYNVSCYGWDSDVEGLVNRIKREDIYKPGFQRAFVWNRAQQSRFIESIILGLPTPDIFLAQDPATRTLNIVDGLQRLTTLDEYLSGKFALKGNIREDLRGKYFPDGSNELSGAKHLAASDMRTLRDAVIRAIIIKPDPEYNDPEKGHEYNKAIIQIFKRLNTGGSPLRAQEIRASVFHGKLNNLLNKLNEDKNWRELFGNEHPRLRDAEIILRTIALIEEGAAYSSPMSRFLDTYMEKSRDMSDDKANEIRSYFCKIMKITNKVLGRDILHSGRTFRLSKLDALAVGLHQYITSYDEIDEKEIKTMTTELENDEEFKKSIDRFVNDKNNVLTRIRRAKSIYKR